MKKLILTTVLLITCLISFGQTYTDGVAYRKTYDSKHKVTENVIYGTYITIEITNEGYRVSGKFGFGHDTYNLKYVSGSKYHNEDDRSYEIEDNLDGYGGFKMTYRSGKETVEYDFSRLQLEKRTDKLNK